MGNIRVRGLLKLAAAVIVLLVVVGAVVWISRALDDGSDEGLDEYFLRDVATVEAMGLPVYWLLNRLGRYKLFTVILASLVPALLFTLFNHEQWPYYLAMAYFSMFVATACWLITTRKE